MPFVLTFREGTGPLRKPFRHGAVVAMRVNGHTYGATLNLPAGVKTAAIRIPDDLPVSFALGKRVFLREGDRWEATSRDFDDAGNPKATEVVTADGALWKRGAAGAMEPTLTIGGDLSQLQMEQLNWHPPAPP